MNLTHTHATVSAYLSELEREASRLERPRRSELLEEIREHIDDALVAAGASDEAAVRNVLERLGSPAEIVAAATPARRRSGWLEIGGLVFLAIPFVGWIVGTVLVVASRAWSGREKAMGFALGLGLPMIMLVGFTAVGADSGGDVQVGAEPTTDVGSGGGLGPLELFSLGTLFLSGPLAAVYLASRLRRRPAADEPASA